jgi:hypothetical protein
MKNHLPIFLERKHIKQRNEVVSIVLRCIADCPVQNLLNPCHCKTTGICKCCKPKTERRSQASGSCCSSDGGATDTLVELYKSRAYNAEASSSRLQPPEISPNSHAHRTSHRAKLYSPYTTPRHTSKSPVATPSSSFNHPLPSRLRPLADMNSFLGAVFNADGTTATEISRSALGLPGINTFDTRAAEGGVKVEAMEIDDNEPVSFPTMEDVIIGACTCGPDCDCPGCSIHGNAEGGDHGPDHTACGHGCKSSFDCTNHLAIPSGATSVEHLLSLAAANVPPPPRTQSGDLDAHDTRIMPNGYSPDAATQLGMFQLKPLECCNGRCQCAPGTCACEKECCGCCIRCACAEDGEGDSNMNQRRESAGNCCSGPTTTTIPTGHARNPSLSVTAPIEPDCCGSSSGTGSGHSPNPSLSFSSADEYFRPSPTLSHHSPRPSLNISTAGDGTMPPFALDSSSSLGVSQPTPPLLSPESARVPSQGIPLLSPESARHPGGSSPSSPHSPHSPRSPRSSRSSLKGRKSAQSSRSSTPARDDGEPATKRRASFTQQGNSSAVDGNESRRATIAAHSPTPSLSRSASTGKASSKALALNTQPNHPSHRNSTSKANSSSSGHLLPPKAGASAVSPHRRRASSGTGQHSPRATTPEPRSPISHGHSASLGHSPNDFQPPTSLPVLPQFTNDQQPPQINIDTVNDDDDFVADPELLAYINQLTSSSAGTSDVSSIPTNYNFDFINPFDPSQQPLQQMGPNQDVNMNMGPNGTISTGDFLSMLNQMNGQQQQPPMPLQQMPPSTSNILSQSMSGLYLGQPQPPMMGYDQSQPRSRDPMHHEYAYMLQQQQQQQQQQNPNKMYNPNPNLIDLSKPLDAGDVERILRALQDQQSSQNHQAQPPLQQQHHQQPQMAQRPPMQMHQQMHQQMMMPQHPAMPHYNMQQQQPLPPPPPPQDDLFDKFMLDPSPSAPETNGQQTPFDFNQMYGGINPNHVHSSMGMGMNGNGGGNGQNGNVQNGNGNGQMGDQLTWEQLRLWAASHGMQAPPGPM